jgi:hypothetical protein
MIMDKKREKINYIAYLSVHKSTSAKDQERVFLPKFRPCQHSNQQRAKILTLTLAMAPIDMGILTILMFIYIL